MNGTWQETYYMVATFGAVGGMISCVVTVMLFFRTRPDRMKSRIDESIAPLMKRIEKVEKEADERDHRRETSMRALDADISGRLRNLTEEVSERHAEMQKEQRRQGELLVGIKTSLDHGITRNELNALHHRVTDVAKQVASFGGQLEGVTRMAENINDYLRDNKP